MNTTLTQSQIDQYQRDGFIHIPGFLNAAEVAELKQAVLDAVTQMGDRKVSDQTSSNVKDDSYYNRVFTQKLNLWKISPTAKRYMLSPDLGVMLARLSGVARQRMWHDQTLIKEPFGNATAWHLDNPYWSFTSKNAISIWIALQDVTPNNGSLSFVPGSHNLAQFDESTGKYKNAGIGMNMDELFKAYPEMAAIDPVHVPMKAGDCSFHNGLTAHGAGANMTRGRRIAMTAGYMPDGSTFNGSKNIMPDWYFNSLTLGQTLNNDELNPLV